MCKITAILILILSLTHITLVNAGDEIVFKKFDSSIRGYRIYVMDRDGKNAKQIVKEPNIRYESPRWSPDGKQIIFTKTTAIDGELWIMDSDGGKPELLHKPAQWEVSWSPDGRKIAFENMEKIYIMDLKTRKIDLLVNGTCPVWSPDGKAIAYGMPFGSQDYKIHLIDPESKREWSIDAKNKNLQILYASYWSPIAWSPDGKHIAFMAITGGKNWWGIYIMNSDGTNVIEKYTGDGGNLIANWPAWSPDGRQIIFHTIRGIERMDIDGEKRELIYENGDEPDWKRPSAIAVERQDRIAITWGWIKQDKGIF